jgi:hypothetical protein
VLICPQFLVAIWWTKVLSKSSMPLRWVVWGVMIRISQNLQKHTVLCTRNCVKHWHQWSNNSRHEQKDLE